TWLECYTDPDNGHVQYERKPNGLVTRQWGGSRFDIDFEYDPQGRMTNMVTDCNGQQVTTECTYDDAGRPDQKFIDGQLTETYRFRNNGQLSSVTDAQNVEEEMVYTPGSPDVQRIDHGTVQGVYSIDARNRHGLPTEMTYLHGHTLSRTYNKDGSIKTERQGGTGDVEVAFSPDHNGITNISLTMGSNSQAMAFKYDGNFRVEKIISGDLRVEYDYCIGSDQIEETRTYLNNVLRQQKNVTWDPANERVTSISYSAIPTNYSYTLGYDANCRRINRITDEAGGEWTYNYYGEADNHQLERGWFTHPGGQIRPGADFSYEYDEFGNMTRLKRRGTTGSLPAAEFEPSNLNLHLERRWGDKALISGEAHTNATILVNGTRATRYPGSRQFEVILDVTNANDSAELDIVVHSVIFDPVVTQDLTTVLSQRLLYRPKNIEDVEFRDTALPKEDSRFKFDWDDPGTLLSTISSNTNPRIKQEYSYYPDHRRSETRFYERTGGSWTLTEIRRFCYDEWNLIREDIYDGSDTWQETKEYLWGLDIFGQRTGKTAARQAAGGIGGLLAITRHDATNTTVYVPVQDHLGNIHKVIEAETGNTVAEYIYSPFGEIIYESGSEKDLCPFRFQSKYYDKVTQLYYYGFRYYDPRTAKWLKREPLGEAASPNLMAFCMNDPVNRIDVLGLAERHVQGTLTFDLDGGNAVMTDAPDIDFSAPDEFGGKRPDLLPDITVAEANSGLIGVGLMAAPFAPGLAVRGTAWFLSNPAAAFKIWLAGQALDVTALVLEPGETASVNFGLGFVPFDQAGLALWRRMQRSADSAGGVNPALVSEFVEQMGELLDLPLVDLLDLGDVRVARLEMADLVVVAAHPDEVVVAVLGELQRHHAFYTKLRTELGMDEQRALSLLCLALFNLNEFLWLD
ncbi:MAG: RHS repeat-associated core domain-containing protein, partial [Verrucomicrobiota bacterium]